MFNLLKKWWNGLSTPEPTTTKPTRRHPERLEKLYIPEYIWVQGMQCVSPFGQHGLEAAVLFYGYVSQLNEGVITTVVCPKQDNQPGYYEITPQSMSEVARKVIMPFRMLILAQMHLHPGNMTEMSSVDKEHAANVSIIGGLQFIVPYYGQKHSQKNLTVHERTRTGWRKWDEAEKNSRIVFLPSSVDLRSSGNGGMF